MKQQKYWYCFSPAHPAADTKAMAPKEFAAFAEATKSEGWSEGRPVRGGRAGQAFTIIELLAVIFLGALLTSLIAPRLHRKKPQETWELLHEQLNQLATFARQEALTKRGTYRLVFQQKPNKQDVIFVEEEYQDPENAERKKYRPAKSDYALTKLVLEHDRSLRAVYLGGRNALSDQEPVVFCYVIPDGMMQPITLQIAKKNKNAEEIVSFQLNPFLGSFDRYEGKVKPE